MTGDVHHEAKAQDTIELTSLPTLGDLYEPGYQRHVQELQSVFQKPEANMSQMLNMMKPLPQDAEYPKEFLLKTLSTCPTQSIILSSVLFGPSKDILLQQSLKAH